MSDIYIPFEDQVISHIVPMNRCPEEVTERLLTRVREMAKRTGQNLDEESTKRLASEIWELAMRICYPSENEEYIEKAELLSSVPTILEPWTEQMETRFSFYKTSMEHLFPERFYFWTEWERIWWDEKTKRKPQDEWEATWPKRRLTCELIIVLEQMSPEEMEKMIEMERKIIECEENDLGLSPYEKSSFEREILTGENHTDLPRRLFDVLKIHEAIQNEVLLRYRVKNIEETYGIAPNNDNRMREFVDAVTKWEQRAHIPGARSLKDILCEAGLIDADPPKTAEPEKLADKTENQPDGVQDEEGKFPDYTWGDVKVAFMDDSTLRIEARGKVIKTLTCEGAEFWDKKARKPNVNWYLLLHLAETGSVNPDKYKSRETKSSIDVKSAVKNIRRKLEKIVNLSNCPIKYDFRDKVYRVDRFALVDRRYGGRGAADMGQVRTTNGSR